MNPYCNLLTLNIPPLKEGYDITTTTTHHAILSLDDINPEIKQVLLDLGIVVSWIELFYRKPGHVGSIHADNLSGDFTKINWIYQGQDSYMSWFTINENCRKKNINVTIANTEYIKYFPNEVTYAYSASISGPALVQVGIPHLVTNPKEDRYCLCFVLCNLQGKRLTMQEAQHLLKDYIQ